MSSSIPPTAVGALIQTHGAQQREAANRQRATDAAADAQRPAFTRELTAAIENNERDGQAHSDAEGSGGYARHESDEPLATDADADEPQAHAGLDLQA